VDFHRRGRTTYFDEKRLVQRKKTPIQPGKKEGKKGGIGGRAEKEL